MPLVSPRRLGTPAAANHPEPRPHAARDIFHDDDDRVCLPRLLTRFSHPLGFSPVITIVGVGQPLPLVGCNAATTRELSRLLAGSFAGVLRHYRLRYAAGGPSFQDAANAAAVEAEPGCSVVRALSRTQPSGGRLGRPTLAASLVEAACLALGEHTALRGHPWYAELGDGLRTSGNNCGGSSSWRRRE